MNDIPLGLVGSWVIGDFAAACTAAGRTAWRLSNWWSFISHINLLKNRAGPANWLIDERYQKYAFIFLIELLCMIRAQLGIKSFFSLIFYNIFIREAAKKIFFLTAVPLRRREGVKVKAMPLRKKYHLSTTINLEGGGERGPGAPWQIFWIND